MANSAKVGSAVCVNFSISFDEPESAKNFYESMNYLVSTIAEHRHVCMREDGIALDSNDVSVQFSVFDENIGKPGIVGESVNTEEFFLRLEENLLAMREHANG